MPESTRTPQFSCLGCASDPGRDDRPRTAGLALSKLLTLQVLSAASRAQIGVPGATMGTVPGTVPGASAEAYSRVSCPVTPVVAGMATPSMIHGMTGESAPAVRQTATRGAAPEPNPSLVRILVPGVVRASVRAATTRATRVAPVGSRWIDDRRRTQS